ncbi:hypothetical protein VPH35_058211 [Triticum aestivum]
MGRGRTEMKRIHNDVSRRATFGKRRRGLLKKARELAVLCGVDHGLLVFDDGGAGKLFDYWSELIERYESITKHQFQFQGQGIHHDDHQQPLADIIAGLRCEHDRLEASMRRQTGEDLPSDATAAELDDLEQRLEFMLSKVREIRHIRQQVAEANMVASCDRSLFLRLPDSISFSLRRPTSSGKTAVERSMAAPRPPDEASPL